MLRNILSVLVVFGTRPEAVKMAPIIRELKKHPDEIKTYVCVTAQHREMLDQVLEQFEIIPDIDLDLMQPSQSLSQLTARIFTTLGPVVEKFKPDWILVQGDTTTVMAASILGFYHHVKIGHVEAGLRTNNKWEPFPEEINRRLAGVVADLHFAPTDQNRQNLLAEGVPERIIAVTGNPVIDALQFIVSQPVPDGVKDILREAQVLPGDRRLILVTAHRRENFGLPIRNICFALKELAEKYSDKISIVYPVHLNPRIQKPVYDILGDCKNITLLPPLDYLSLIHLMKRSTLVLTDSGGIQEEAPALGIPTLVLRNTTELPEGVAAGTLKLVGTDPAQILKSTSELLENDDLYNEMSGAVNPFGDRHASERIVAALLEQNNLSSF